MTAPRLDIGQALLAARIIAGQRFQLVGEHIGVTRGHGQAHMLVTASLRRRGA